MSEVYHIAVLFPLAFFAERWSMSGTLNTAVKLLLIGFFVWGSLVAAIDWVKP